MSILKDDTLYNRFSNPFSSIPLQYILYLLTIFNSLLSALSIISIIHIIYIAYILKIFLLLKLLLRLRIKFSRAALETYLLLMEFNPIAKLRKYILNTFHSILSVYVQKCIGINNGTHCPSPPELNARVSTFVHRRFKSRKLSVYLSACM